MTASPQRTSFSLGLIGYPLGHSISPFIHRAALQALGLWGDYQLFPVPPLPVGEAVLGGLIERLRSGELHGLNVTIPHKSAVIPFTDELSPTARATGAVNTLVMRSGKLLGENTDVPGFIQDLARQGVEISRGGTALVLGAGGAARAVIYALAQSGWQVVVAARRLLQAEELASSLRPHLHSPSLYTLQLDAQPASQFSTAINLLPIRLLVNATPLGMSPNSSSSPWHSSLCLPEHAFIYDLVYNPLETHLLRQARSAGIQASNGLGMLVEQAALSFEIWTGFSPPRDTMIQSAYSSLSSL